MIERKNILAGISILAFYGPFAVAADLPLSMADASPAVSPDTAALEEGKALYENGQPIAALGKFMTVLRNDPHNADARQYLRMIIDNMRQNPAISASKMGNREQAVASNPAVQEEVRRMFQQRTLFTMDLKAIPGVKVSVKENVHQVDIETPLLFADNSGGLKEQGIPILDRVGAWLKTYGQQPVIIHCYPEELLDPAVNGSLFLHRYSELFNFFVDERKLSPQRFVSADLLHGSSPTPPLRIGGSAEAGVAERGEDAQLSTTTARVVIETMGSQSAALEAMPVAASRKSLSRWLELSITPIRPNFNPEEGEWVSLDAAALTRTGLRNWALEIVPAEGKNPPPVLQLQGKGNLLKRVAWDGHDEKTGSFVPGGSYLAKLVATDADGTIMNREVPLQVLRTTAKVPTVLAQKPKPKKKAKQAKAKKPKPEVVVAKAPTATPTSSFPPVSGGEPIVPRPEAAGDDVKRSTGGNDGHTKTSSKPAVSDSDSLLDSPPASAVPAASAVSAVSAPASDSSDSVHAIWKQVIQFEAGQSDLKPTVKASLERIGKTLEVYPLQKVRITGFAMTSEANSKDLAAQRAATVRKILVEEYHVDAKRVIIAGGMTTTADNASKVEMSITN